MTDQTDADTLLPSINARNGGEHLGAEEMPTVGYAHATRPEAVPLPDLRLPCGDQASDVASGVDALVAPDPVHCGRS